MNRIQGSLAQAPASSMQPLRTLWARVEFPNSPGAPTEWSHAFGGISRASAATKTSGDMRPGRGVEPRRASPVHDSSQGVLWLWRAGSVT